MQLDWISNETLIKLPNGSTLGYLIMYGTEPSEIYRVRFMDRRFSEKIDCIRIVKEYCNLWFGFHMNYGDLRFILLNKFYENWLKVKCIRRFYKIRYVYK